VLRIKQGGNQGKNAEEKNAEEKTPKSGLEAAACP